MPETDEELEQGETLDPSESLGFGRTCARLFMRDWAQLFVGFGGWWMEKTEQLGTFIDISVEMLFHSSFHAPE